MVNHRYTTLSEAAEIAAIRCDRWRFAMSDELYDRTSLQGIAKIHDEEAGVDEESFYVVSPGGAMSLSLMPLNLSDVVLRNITNLFGITHFQINSQPFNLNNQDAHGTVPLDAMSATFSIQ